jgi:hypothetical protein
VNPADQIPRRIEALENVLQGLLRTVQFSAHRCVDLLPDKEVT